LRTGGHRHSRIKKNGIGKVVMITASYNRNNTAGAWRDYGEWEPIKDPKAAGLDWDKWLGHEFTCAGQQLAPKRDWDARRFFQFRCYWDYSGGTATDLLFHTLTEMVKAAGLDYPERVVASPNRISSRRPKRVRPFVWIGPGSMQMLNDHF
jgi:hypothetical protein